MRIANVDAATPLFDAVYNDVIRPSFLPDELVSLEDLRAAVLAKEADLVAIVDESDAPIAAAVGEWSPTTEIVLLAYLAVRSGVRSTGLGGELLSHVTALWRTRWKPVAILAEIEHPLAHSATEAYGDPVKRLRFYARHGLRALDIPYFQPALKPGFGRVFGILLTLVWLSDEGVGAEPDTADGERIRRYLVEYLTATEGRAGADEAAKALLTALDRRGGVPILSLDDPSVLPFTKPPAAG
jgi:GNAT superfamily N-acetyltransferase